MASFRKRNGKWEYRFTIKLPNGKRQEISKAGFKTKALATAAALDAESKIKTNGFVAKNQTLYSFFIKWSNIYKKPYVKEKTWASYLQTQRHIKSYFKNTKLTEITPTEYQYFLNDFGKKYAQDTIERTHYHIKSALKVATREGIIRFNFADNAIVKSQLKKQSEKNKFLEENEYLELIKTTSKHPEYTSYFTIYLIAKTGMRYAECAGLTWNDIDFENGYIDINKTFDYSISKEFASTKNEQSNRKIPIDKNTIKIIKDFQKNYYQDNPLGRICFGSSNSIVNREIKKIVGRKVSIHSLRHTYASFLIFKGIDLISISKLLGHDSLNITLKVYAHQLDQLKERNDQLVREIFQKL